MSTMSLRLPESLHRKLRELAKREGISINQLATMAVAEKISALLTEEYLAKREKCGEGIAGTYVCDGGLGPDPHGWIAIPNSGVDDSRSGFGPMGHAWPCLPVPFLLVARASD
jgi:predicted transcriptional regulator